MEDWATQIAEHERHVQQRQHAAITAADVGRDLREKAGAPCSLRPPGKHAKICAHEQSPEPSIRKQQEHTV